VTSNEDSPAGGQLDLIDVGLWEYTPGTGFTGSDAFSYRLFDGTDYSLPALVTFEQQPAPPSTPTTPLITDVTETWLTGFEDEALGSVTVAVFESAAADVLDWTATIDWGDGTTTTGQIVADGDGRFRVVGEHTYDAWGLYLVQVTLTDTAEATHDLFNLASIQFRSYTHTFTDPVSNRTQFVYAEGDTNVNRYVGNTPTTFANRSGQGDFSRVDYGRLKFYACAQCHGSPDGQFHNLILLGHRARLDDLPAMQWQMLQLTASGSPVTFSEFLRRLDESTSTPGVQIGTPVGEPGLVEGLIPIWGNGRTAVNAFQTGHWGKGVLFIGLTLLDVFLAKSVVQGGLRLGVQLLGKEGAEAAAQIGGKVTAEFGLTMLGGTPQRLASTQAEIDALYRSLLKVANSRTFINQARQLGFSEEQIAQLPGKITQYYESGQLGWIKTGGWVDESNLLIGKSGLFSRTGRMRHELGHVLDEIAHPGLMARSRDPRAFGFIGYFKAEMTAFGTQLHPYNPVRPWLAGLTASHNRFGYWGSVPYIGGSVAALSGAEYLLLQLLDQ
jgi:hypothetical protein